jgi:hypothetical protein
MASCASKQFSETSIGSETTDHNLNSDSQECKPSSAYQRSPYFFHQREDEFFSTVGSALDELLADAKCKYQDPPSCSPVPSTAETTPQVSPTVLPPPPGYDPIVEPDCCNEETGYYDDPSLYSSPTYSWRSYPPPYYLGHKLFVGALPYSVTEADLFPLFGQFGDILELHIQRDYLGRSKGCAWLRYSTTDECDAAINALHNNYYLGSMNRPLQLTYASDKFPAQRPRTSSMNEEVTHACPTHVQSRGRAMTDCGSIPTPSSSVLGKLRQMMSSSSQSITKIGTDADGGPSPVKEDGGVTVFQVSGLPAGFSDTNMTTFFTQFGPLIRLERISPSTAVVEFKFPSDADRAKSVINGVTLDEGDAPITVLAVV